MRRAVIWYRRFRPLGFLILWELGKYHPRLVPRAKEAIRAGKYRDEEV